MEESEGELLLKESDKESTEEVSKLIEYDTHKVGSFVNTDFLMVKPFNA